MSHLLILKQQIVAFDIEYVAPEVSFDFSGVTSTFWELRERGGLRNRIAHGEHHQDHVAANGLTRRREVMVAVR